MSLPKKKTDVDVSYETYHDTIGNNRSYSLNGSDNSNYISEFGHLSKGVHSIESMKRLEESAQQQKAQQTTTQQSNQEKFKGFCYKNNHIEPFEKTYVSY